MYLIYNSKIFKRVKQIFDNYKPLYLIINIKHFCMIVKTLQLRKNLKEVLLNSFEEDTFLDYYGDLFKIVPVAERTKKITQTQRIIDKFSKISPRKLTSTVFNGTDAAQEKSNFRNLKYNKND